MLNLIWFILLVLFSAGIIIYTYRKTEFRKNLAVYFFTLGLSFIMEFVVLIIGGAYSYYPNVFSDPWNDDVFGSSISQALFIPSVLMAIAAFRIKIKWVLLIIAAIYLIEELFLRLGLYEHHWWRSWYTAIILLMAVFIIKWWRTKIEHPSLIIRFITIYMATTTIIQALSFYMEAIFKTHWYSIGWFDAEIRDRIAFNTSYWLVYSLLLTVIVLFAYHYLTLAALFLGDFLLNLQLINMGILHINPYWHPALFGVIILIFVSFMRRLNSYLFPLVE